MRIDHLVWYNADLDHGCRHFAAQMDAEPVYGGEHPGEGTANALLSLGPSTYLEILGRDTAQDQARLDPEVAGLRGHGLYHWAVGGVDLAELAQRAAAAGLAGGALVPGGRLKPDGKRLDWVCWGLSGHGFGSLVPFFIDWRESEHPARSAPRGGRIATFLIHTPEAERLRALFGTLGLEIPVLAAEEARVEVVLESEKGRMTLQSFAPVPRGYVI
ncbi:hypothetical protein DK847_01235 [Aestuariivirga litoralis]|uniref:Glyoxalase-like domain-containing protein n=1 Tax=Aestuariivirga litoralis TaxID=2650924 RepID=A0A2W2B0P2_9HYPH|nr:VOC family protein [Aestuariivirga litoralis]PZF78470.1 hypothetical protein DK847_01235 [Aestuariivirga litoralis]